VEEVEVEQGYSIQPHGVPLHDGKYRLDIHGPCLACDSGGEQMLAAVAGRRALSATGESKLITRAKHAIRT